MTTLNENNQTSDSLALADAHKLLSYILKSARNKQEIILPSVTFFDGAFLYGWETFNMNNSRVADWLETVDRVKKERAETKKLTAQVEKILETEYGLKPKAKKSAK